MSVNKIVWEVADGDGVFHLPIEVVEEFESLSKNAGDGTTVADVVEGCIGLGMLALRTEIFIKDQEGNYVSLKDIEL